MRRAARRIKSRSISLPAPVRGVVENAPIAVSDPLAAEYVENFLPTQRGFRVRGGYARAALVGDAVEAMFGITGAFEKLFAATSNAIYEIASFTPETASTPSASGLTSGAWVAQQVGTAGDNYLVAVNGADKAHIYDGSSLNPWTDEAVNQISYDALTTDFDVGETLTGGTSSATAEILGVTRLTATTGTLKIGAVTGGPFQDNEALTSASGSATADGTISVASALFVTGVDTAALSHVWLYRSRLFFIEGGTLKAWYLNAGVVGGVARDINLAGVFRRGGSLVLGGTWSLDTGDGIDDKCIFISSEGEVAVYAGSDPSDSAQWALEGRYDIGKPLSNRGIMRAGGDIIIATDDGIVPLSQVVQKDPAALSLAAVTRDIADAWRNEVSQHTGGAALLKWTDENLALALFPDSKRLLTVNLQTGAWAFQTGWFGDCAEQFNGDVYVGRSDGRIYKLNVTGTDDGDAFTARLCYAFNDMGDPSAYKVANMARAAWFAATEFAYSLSISIDYKVEFPAPPSATINGVGSAFVWGVSNWGEAVWSGNVVDPPSGRQDQWQAVSGAGYALAPVVQITSGDTLPLDVEFVRVDLNVEMGGRAS